MNSRERIEMLVNAIGGRSEMARRLGVGYQNINSWYATGKVTMACVKSIHALLPWVNLNWLIFGEGDADIYGKEHTKMVESFESLLEENDKLKKIIEENITSLKKYDVQKNS